MKKYGFPHPFFAYHVMYVSYFVLGGSWVGAWLTYLTTLWSLCHLYSRESVRYVLYSVSSEVSVFCLVAFPLRHFSGKKTDSRPLLYPGAAERIWNCVGRWGVRAAHKRASEAPTWRGVSVILPQKLYKPGNTTFIINFWFEIRGGLSPPAPWLRRPWYLTAFESISVIRILLFRLVRVHWICRVASVRRLFRNVWHPIGNEDFTSRGWTWLRGSWRQGEGLGSTISRQQTKMEGAMPTLL